MRLIWINTKVVRVWVHVGKGLLEFERLDSLQVLLLGQGYHRELKTELGGLVGGKCSGSE
jgi:hypothetical protein